MEEFPELQTVVDRGFEDPANVDLVFSLNKTHSSINTSIDSDFPAQALDYLGRSQGIQRTKDLAADHAGRAAVAVESLPVSHVNDALISRRALIDLTRLVLTRTK